MSIKVIRLHHHSPRPGGPRRDVAELRDFYTRVLGFAADPMDPATFHGPGYSLRLGYDEREPVCARLDVADIEAARAELRRLGVPHHAWPSASGNGPVSLRLSDPAGNDIELRQFDGPRATSAPATPTPRDYLKVRAAVMFADMRGFTGASERLSPSDVVPLLNEYCDLLVGIATGHGGVVFNMAGDGLMIGFGVPREQPDSARRAFSTAREMLASFRLLAENWRRRLDIDVGLGIGINAGEVIAGRVGTGAFTSYTIVGDAVNVAARLSQRARAGEALFSHEVRRQIDLDPAEGPVVELPALTLRGRAAPVSIYCLQAAERIDFRVI